MSFRDSISDRPATIRVGRGPHAGVFTIPKALLCNSSPYFKAALNGSFIEGGTQTIHLDDEEPVIFKTYVAWLYQGQLHSQDIEGALDDPSSFGQHIAELIIFADKRDVPELQNDAISMFLSFSHKSGLVSIKTIDCIYSMPKSKEITHLRWLLAHEEVCHGHRLSTNINHWHPEFMAEIIRVYKTSAPLLPSRMLGGFDSGRSPLCALVHRHARTAETCSSATKNTYIPAPPPDQEHPAKRRRIGPSTERIELIDDSE